MQIDVVIPYRLSPFTNSIELKYCLRSIEKHLKGVGQIWVIGEHPNYINHNNVAVIGVEETNWYQYLTRNIHNKLMLACESPVISDPFLYMNDDHFLLQDTRAVDIPYYHNSVNWSGTGKYKITIANTLNKYPDAFNFDVHAPMLIHKKFYQGMVGGLNWKTPFGFAIKTAYCRPLNIKGEYYQDYKINHQPGETDFIDILARKFFSVGDKAVNKDMVRFLKELYPNKSMYEI